MNAVRPLPATLVGRFVQLEPLTATLLPELHRAIAHPAVFAGGYGGGPAGLCSDVDEANEAAHIGWTAFDPRVWGTAVNAETKLLLLGTVFDHGFGRVKIQADAINERSRAARPVRRATGRLPRRSGRGDGRARVGAGAGSSSRQGGRSATDEHPRRSSLRYSSADSGYRGRRPIRASATRDSVGW